jgi:hypothetical protein
MTVITSLARLRSGFFFPLKSEPGAKPRMMGYFGHDFFGAIQVVMLLSAMRLGVSGQIYETRDHFEGDAERAYRASFRGTHILLLFWCNISLGNSLLLSFLRLGLFRLYAPFNASVVWP